MTLDYAGAPIKRDELFDLHEHYETAVTEHLRFCYDYLNFYTGLHSAVLAATLAGLFEFKLQYPLGLLLLFGPVLSIMLATIGFKTFTVFYRRSVEAWITVINIEAMLGLRGLTQLDEGVQPPLYKSRRGGGFIALFERSVIEDVLSAAKARSKSAEEVLAEVVRLGDTRKYARLIFVGFAFMAAVVFGVIIAVVVPP